MRKSCVPWQYYIKWYENLLQTIYFSFPFPSNQLYFVFKTIIFLPHFHAFFLHASTETYIQK